MNTKLAIAFIISLFRAALTHGVCEALRILIEAAVPDVPPLMAFALGILIGVLLTELAEVVFRHRGGRKDGG